MMASLYLCNVEGDGTSAESAYRPAVTASAFTCLMLDSVRGKALIVSPDDSLAGAGVNRLLQAATMAGLRTKARTTNPTAAQRTALNTWLLNGGYQPLTAQLTWAECVGFAARQVNSAADLEVTA